MVSAAARVKSTPGRGRAGRPARGAEDQLEVDQEERERGAKGRGGSLLVGTSPSATMGTGEWSKLPNRCTGSRCCCQPFSRHARRRDLRL